MITAELSRIKRFGKRAFRVALCSMLVMQALWVPNSSLAAMSAFGFRGYDAENISAGSLSYASSGASVSGRSITISPLAGEGEVIGLVNLNETGGDITKSVDLGGLEIDFSAVSSIIQEGENGADNDAPTVKILFCSSGDIGSVISSVTLKKQDPAVAGSETLSSGAKIPGGTRSIFLSFQGASKTGTNTVSFSNISLVIHDSGAPSCSADYLQNWTNQDVTVTITAADSDAGLEGIYINDVRMSETSPYVFTVSTNNTSFSAYALDLAGKKSEVVSGTIDHIDKTTPSAPSSVPLSNSAWTNGDVFVQMPALSTGTGSPERYVYQIGAGAWTDLPAEFAISAEGNTVIRVAVADAACNRSASAQATAKIDKSAPTISDAVITPGSLTAKVDVSASEVGLSGMQKFCYAAGNQTADYFTTGGTLITGSTFNVSSGGTYTIYAADNAGNKTLKTIAITTAPKFDTIGNVVTDEDEMCSVALSVYDAESSISHLIFRITVSDNDLLDPVTLHQTDDGASLDITPAANRSGGPVNVTVVVEDESGLTATRSFTVTVEPVNDDPIAQDDLDIAVLEDGVIEIDVLANDGDAADGDTVSISNVGKAANGTTLNVLGKIRYTPNENFAGTDTFIYDITDGKGGTAQAKVTLIVNQVNDAPTAVNDKAYTAEDTALTIDALNNDSDPDMPTNEQETIVLASCVNGAHGTAQIVEGKIVYTPNADFNGTDTFGYTIADKAGITAEATVTVVVSPETDAPRFAGLSDEYTIDEDATNHEIAFEIYDVETPADSVMLQAATLNEEMIDPSGVVISGLGDRDPAVKLLLTPATNMHGDVSLKLTLGDGFDSVERTILIHINNVNDAPRTGSDTKTFTEDAAYLDISIASLLLNDSDIDGDPIFFDGLASDPSVGAITLLDEATLRYTPAHDFDGTTSFTYYVSDGTARTLATCTLTANGVNDAPSIVVDETELYGTEDTWIVIPFRISDNESDPKDLKVIAASSDARVITTDGIQIINNNDGTGEVRILPAADAFGSPILTLTVSDGEAHASDTVKLIIAPAQDAPIAEADLIYAHYTARLTFGVLANDHDVDGDEIEISGFTEDLPGSLTLDEATQIFTYVPAVGENGIKTFRYAITDGTAESSATVTLNVMSETNAPVITAIDSRYVGEDETVSGIAFSVSDEDAGDTASIRVDSDDTTLLPEDEAHITVNDLTDGNYTLTLKPGVDQTGSTRVTVTVTDDAGLTDSTSFYLHVIAQNDAPVAADDTLSVDEDGALALTLLANDTDADKDTIWLSNLTTPAHGYIERVGNDYTYYPYADWSGTESLTYRISDGRAYAQASVSITVNPVNDAPVARDDWKSVPNDLGTESATIDVLHNDYDTDSGDVIHTLDIVTPPLYGTATVQPDGTILYTRTQISPLGNGADSFRYRMIDRANTEEPGYESATATVHIGEVFTGSLNTYDKHVTCYEDDKPFTIELSVDNPAPVDYALTVNTTTTLGTFEVLDNNTVRFQPAADQYGYAAITYTVEQIDGGQKDTGTIWLRVYPVNDLPEITAVPDSITFTEDASEGNVFDVEFHDADCANDDLYFYAYTKSEETTAPIPFMVSYSVTRTGAGSRVTIRTAENVNGSGVIVVGVSDGMTYDEAEIDLNVTPVDDAPKTNDITRTMKEDSCITFASPGSDCDVDGDTIVETIDPMHQPQNGRATIGANRTIRYVPNANFSGEETFYVIVTDQTETGLSAAAKVTIEVTPVNDAPEIHDLAYYQTTQEDSAIDVQLRVSDIDNDLTESTSYTLTSEDDTLVTNGNISISHVDGDEMVIHVVPEANAYGTVKINVAASDGSLSANGAFLLKIVPVNDPPEAEDDADSVNEAVSVAGETKAPQTVATIDLLHNDSDVEDGSPSIVAISDIVNAATVTNIGGGKVLVAADGNFSGKVTFRYTVMDRAGATDSADVTLTILPMNDPPTAKPDSFTINEDAAPLFSVLGNDSDPEGNTLSIFEVSDPAHGSATIDGTKISYVPTANYNGKDSFTYTVSDGNGGTATATVSITIKPVNDAPTVSKHSSNLGKWTTLEDTTKAFHFVVADAESPVNNLIIKITSLDETLVKTTQIALSTSEAGYKTITVTPNENVHGELDLKIWVSDGSLTGEGVYPLEIISVNDAPVVTAPGVKTKEDTSVHAIATAVDPDGDEVAFDAWTTPKNGTVVINADGSFDYTPNKDFNGADSFIIRVVDITLDQKAGYATVSITVEPDGDPPVAGDDEIDIDEDSPIAITVLDNDSDEDALYGDVISILRVTKPAHGTAVIDGDTILYTPAKDYNGTDSFVYTITDKDGKTDMATVSVVIQPVNDAPSGGNDTATVEEDHSVTIDVTRNDDVDETTNPEMEDVVIVSIDTPAHGTATPSSDNKSILYTPNADWFSPENEPEVFYYTAKDSSDKTERFSVSVTVTPVNDLPVITPDNLEDVTTAEDTRTQAITFTVSDVETAAGSLTVTATHLNGVLLPAITLRPDANGACSFTVLPYENKVGSATITVKVEDADGGEDSDEFLLTVTPVNDAPKAGDDAFTVAENATYTADVLANDDVDTQPNNGGDTLTLLSNTNPQYGTATIVDNKIYYVPKSDRDTSVDYYDTFTYTMQDEDGNSCTPTVTVKVTPVNDPPKISAIASVTGVLEDAPNGTGDIGFSVTDEEDNDDTLSVSIACNNTALFPLSNITITNPTDDATGSLRTVKAIPAANKFGTAKITLTVKDSKNATTSTFFNVTVLSVDDVPNNGNKSFTVVEDVEKQLDLLKDIDPDYATTPGDFTITKIDREPSHGTVRIATDQKTVYYKTVKDSNAADSFDYTIYDLYGKAYYTFTASITVTPVNDAPVIRYLGSAEYTISEGTQKNDIPFTVEDVDNVAFAGGASPVEVNVTAKSSNSILLVNGIHIDTLEGYNRDIDLKPYLKWNGSTTVTITATDPDGESSSASFVLNVSNVNDVPVAVNDTGTIPEDKATAFDVLENDTDGDLITNPDAEKLKVNSVTDEDENATITISDDALSVIVTPNENYNGPVQFTYTVVDASGAVSEAAVVRLTVSQVNDAPLTGPDAAETQEDTAVKIYVLDNDDDLDLDPDLNAHPGDESIGVLITGTELKAPSHGTIATDGETITYTPSANYNGIDTFDYYCSDETAKTIARVTVTIRQVNDSPTANPDSMTIDEDSTTGWVDVMANDTDVDIDSALNQDAALLREKFYLSAASVVNPAVGTVARENNMVKFTPAANWNGTAVVYYTLQDGYGSSCTTGLSVTVKPVNDPPVFTIAPDDLELTEDGTNGVLEIAVDDVETAKNDLIVTVTNTTNATLIALTDVTITKGADGARTITVNPKNNQNGEAVIELTVMDGANATSTETFKVTVAAVNDDPTAGSYTLDISEDAALQTIAKSLLVGDVDIATNRDELTLWISTAARHGTASVDANGSVTYIPNSDFNGTDTFVYTVKDKANATATGTFSVNIAQVNDAPLTEPDAVETQEDTAVKIYVLENDDDVDLDPELNAHPGDESIGVRITGTELKAPSHGTIATDGETITYTPSANYNGVDTFDYYCSDGTVSTIARVTLTIRQVNDSPAAKDDGTTADEDKPVRYDVLANDTDTDTVKELNEDELHSRNDFVIESYSFVGEAHGTVEIDGASIVFTPEADFSGTQAVRYVLSDGKGGTSAATLTILVGSEEDAPVANADSMRAEEDHTASVNVLENDTDVDTGDTKTFDGFVGTIEGLPGTFATDENGDVSFTPNANYNGTFEVIYQVVDSAGLTDTATLRVTITPVNDAPAANDASAETDEDTAKEIDVSTLIGDADILTNEDVITVSIQEAGEPAHGTAQVSGTKITYTPDADFNGADEIVYTVTDADGASDTGTLDITVRPVNDAPEAGDDEATLGEDTVKEISVLVNDGDIDTLAALNLSPAEQPFIRSVTDGAHGKATTDGSKIIYTPDENYNGTDTITYVLTDGTLEDSASVAITIEQRNDAIHAEDDSAKTDDEDTVTLDVLHNDWDVDTDEALNEDELHLRASFRITAVGTPENGKAEIVAGKIDYTPNDRFSGTDSFTYTITDGNETTASAKVTINVISVNDPPVILAVSSPKDGDRAGTGSKVAVEWSGFDIDGDVLTYRLEYYDGKAWQLLDNNLTDTKYVFAIPDSLASTAGLKFRVNARDAEFTSEYGYSGAMQVDKDAPKGTVVTMKTADGRAYTAGTWTNQTVTVVASSAVDASRVTYYYDMDGGASAAAAGMDVVAGVHTVNINAADEYNNTAVVGAYLARVDKQQPAVPEIRESISGGSVLLTLTLQADPGGSGNDKLALPDGTSVKASGRPTFTVAKNGVYSFTLTDIAGNRRVFTHTVNSADVSKPIITLSSGAYRVGTATQDAITAALTFADSESDLVSRGYQLSTSGTPGGSYRTYEDALRMSDPGTYYVHAYAKNAFGLTAYETFGPFIVEAAQAPDASPTPEPQSGDVVVTKEDIEEIPGDTVKIRLPGKEWSETLTLEDVAPGTYLIEAMDEDGNIRSVEVRVTMRDIIARSVRSAGDQVTAAAIVVITALAAIAIVLLLAGYNVTVVVVGSHGEAQQKLRTLRRIKFRRKELVIKLEDKHLMNGEFCDLKIAKPLSKQMRKNTVIVTMRGAEVLREQIPEDFDEAFRRKIRIER